MGSRALKHRHGTRNKRRYAPFLIVFAILAAFAVVAFSTVMVLGNMWLKDLPDYEDQSKYNLARKTQVYASDGETLLAEFYLEDREPLDSLEEVGDYVVMATIDTEDERFYEHNGIDIMGIARAAVNNITGGAREGASTLTQQFVRSTVLASEAGEQTYKRKLREAYIALKLEEIYSKDEILLMYLNTVNYGSGAYGIEAAADRYFQKSADELTLTEAATLAGIPQSPTYNNPIDYPEESLERRNTVLSRMLSNGDITQEEYDAAVAEPMNIDPAPAADDDGILLYPYFTSYVRQVLLESYTEEEIFKGGLTVITTLDVDAQKQAETAVSDKLEPLEDDIEMALVAVDPETGFIKALVGGRDYEADEFNLATQATRQPGSSFKTFTLAAAIEDGIDPNTTVDCSSTVKIDNWSVENYGKASYGTKTIAGAFAVSSNTGFARLIDVLGPEAVVDMAERCGIETPLEAVPSITLGSEGVTVREMAGAYATIANGGIHRDAVAIQTIKDKDDNVIFEADTEGERVISEEVAKATEQVMEGVVTGGTGTEAALGNGQEVAGKTGTSEQWRDSWFCGITPQYSVAIWMGARQERTMPESYTATSVFRSFVGPMIAGVEQFPMEMAALPNYRTLTTDETKKLNSGAVTDQYYHKEDDEEDEDEDEESETTTGGDDEGGTTDTGGGTTDAGGNGNGAGGNGGGAAGTGGTGGATDAGDTGGGAADAGGNSTTTTG